MTLQIVISAEQIAERDSWQQKLMNGECSLMDATFMMLSTGAPATQYLLDRLVQAQEEYTEGGAEDFADVMLGYTVGRREKNKMNAKSVHTYYKGVIDSFHEKGFPKQDPSSFAETAFHEASKVLHKSPSTLFDLYYKK